jgi:hypothetical protein
VQGGAACGDEYLPGIFTNIVEKSVLDFVKLKSGLNKGELKCSVFHKQLSKIIR